MIPLPPRVAILETKSLGPVRANSAATFVSSGSDSQYEMLDKFNRDKTRREKAEQEEAAHLRDEMRTQAYLHELHEKKAKIKLASN